MLVQVCRADDLLRVKWQPKTSNCKHESWVESEEGDRPELRGQTNNSHTKVVFLFNFSRDRSNLFRNCICSSDCGIYPEYPSLLLGGMIPEIVRYPSKASLPIAGWRIWPNWLTDWGPTDVMADGRQINFKHIYGNIKSTLVTTIKIWNVFFLEWIKYLLLGKRLFVIHIQEIQMHHSSETHWRFICFTLIRKNSPHSIRQLSILEASFQLPKKRENLQNKWFLNET